MTLPPHFFFTQPHTLEQKKKIHDETKKILFFFPNCSYWAKKGFAGEKNIAASDYFLKKINPLQIFSIH